MPQPQHRRAGGHLQAVPDSRRRPRRDDTVSYRVRVQLADVEPAVWRRIEIASDLTLDRVHDVLQVVMGWQDSHLHQFTSGDSLWDPKSENYVMPTSLDDDVVGIDERRVRLDEVLVDPGDWLLYQYDFGDNWIHTLDLEEVIDREPGEPAACLDGARACPPEDCGGTGGYDELVHVLADPADPEHDRLRMWAGEDFDPEHFDVDEVSGALMVRGGLRAPAIDPGSVLGDLLARIYVPPSIGDALDGLSAPVPAVTADERRDAVRLYTWLLERIGDGGVKLTSAGYLPPALVRETAVALGLDDDAAGPAYREHHTGEVLHFRESARQLGLVRKANGRLSLTRTGSRARTDPELLWQHIVDVLPVAGAARGPQAEGGRQAGALFLLAVAAGLPKDERKELVREGLSALGWRDGSGESLTSGSAYRMLRATSATLEYLDLLPRRHTWPEPPAEPVSAAAISFARAALGG